jgi:hypothetical protein
MREVIGAPLPPVDRPSYDSDLSGLRVKLGESTFTETWADAAERPFMEFVEEMLTTNHTMEKEKTPEEKPDLRS